MNSYNTLWDTENTAIAGCIAILIVLSSSLIIRYRRVVVLKLRAAVSLVKGDAVLRDALVSAARHAVILGLIFGLLFVVGGILLRQIEAMGGRLPSPVQALVNAREAIWCNGFWPVAFVLLWPDVVIYRHLHRTRGPNAARRWSRGVTGVLFGLLGYYLILTLLFIYYLMR